MSEKTEQHKNADLPEQLSEVLLMLDNEKKKMSIVKGIKDGKPETVAPKAENQNQFLKINGRGDVFSNFYDNFISQIKHPTRFRFFKVPHGLALKVARFLQKHMEHPTEVGKALMEQYEVADKQTENKQQQNHNNMENQEVKTEKDHNAETSLNAKTAGETQNRYKYNTDEVDWTLLDKMGLGKERLEKMKVLDQLLRGFKTNRLVNVGVNLEGVPISFDARVSLQRNENNQVVPAFHGIRREPNLNYPFYGHTFSQQDKENLQADGNMGRVVDLINPRNSEVIPSLISIDKLTNEIVAMPKAWVKIPEEISSVKLTEQQKEDLANGKPLELKGMISRKGTTFDAKVQYNAEKRYVEYLFDEKPKLSADKVTQTQRQEAPRIYRGKEFTDKQHESLNNGKTLYIRDFKDGEGKKYGGYITYNKEKGITEFSYTDPRKVQGQATTAEESKTQKAVNSDGKTNEATKHIKEPLEPKQTAPKNDKQQRQQKKASAVTKSKKMKV